MAGIIKILGVIVTIIYVAILITEKLDKSPIRLKNFKTSEALEDFLYKKYHLSSNMNIPFKDLELSGARCSLATKKDNIPNDLKKYEYSIWCDYLTPWFSWPPKEHYQVIIIGNKNREIIKFLVSKYSGFMI